jgi:hypothetical protein
MTESPEIQILNIELGAIRALSQSPAADPKIKHAAMNRISVLSRDIAKLMKVEIETKSQNADSSPSPTLTA